MLVTEQENISLREKITLWNKENINFREKWKFKKWRKYRFKEGKLKFYRENI